MKNSKNKTEVRFPRLDRELLEVTEETIIEFMIQKGPDFRKCDGWVDTIVRLRAACVQYIAVKNGHFYYFKELPVGDFDLIINVVLEAAKLPNDELDAASPDYQTIRARTGLYSDEPHHGYSSQVSVSAR